MTVRPLALIHYSANQLGRRHDLRELRGEKKVSKTKRLIGFCFIGRTHRDHAGKYFTETTGNPALSSAPLFLYLRIYVCTDIQDVPGINHQIL